MLVKGAPAVNESQGYGSAPSDEIAQCLDWSQIQSITVMSHEDHCVSNRQRFFVRQLVWAYWKDNIKILHHWPFVRGIRRSPKEPPHKGPVLEKALSEHAMPSSCADLSESRTSDCTSNKWIYSQNSIWWPSCFVVQCVFVHGELPNLLFSMIGRGPPGSGWSANSITY